MTHMYIKKLEEQNEELQRRLSVYENCLSLVVNIINIKGLRTIKLRAFVRFAKEDQRTGADTTVVDIAIATWNTDHWNIVNHNYQFYKHPNTDVNDTIQIMINHAGYENFTYEVIE